MLTPTKAYDEYWIFARNRHEKFLKKQNKIKDIANHDPIIDIYKFTNCYRVLDRTSQFLIREIIYADEFKLSAEETFFRTILFKIFNKIQTWEQLELFFGEISLSEFDSLRYCQALEKLKNGRTPIYSAAYIMPSGKQEYGSPTKHENNIKMIELMLKREMHKRVWDCTDLKDLYHMFLQVPTIGPFLAYQYSIDIAYSEHSQVTEDQFVVAGPGAIRGINKCFSDTNGRSNEYVIKHMTDQQEIEFKRLGIEFNYIKGRKLQLIDCQNIFCETDKYLRKKMPGIGKSNARIKQKYKESTKQFNVFLPPKWNLDND